jgi:GAF domain-containing protein
MRTGDEVLGALVIQNTQLATGFDETDQHLLSNLAAQVAIVLRCRRQAASTRIQAERGQLLTSLTRKIWTYSDRDAILRTALEETGRYLHASSGLIQLEYSDDEGGKVR